ncbi:hypothetical protein B0J11DRAFT_151587 [Dendryphion nanum]|uniref:Uncharacterized protein n=1 Tax=Dendryphion nanum TaxID=256645 RepID=A0A9P9E9G8_9PLEO|nr:hypothetical protein B0J11DRAFT_151587 [Dendryphion nanum]
MNTVKSVYYGWGTLIVAGGGAYYFAKKSINADRAAKAEKDHQKRLALYQLEQAHFNSNNNTSPYNAPRPAANTAAPNSITSQLGKKKGEMNRQEREDKDWHSQVDEASNPSHEASHDPAPTRHEPEDEGQKMREKSKYEASEVFRSRKGDRFS